ncbi:hypothetical protein CMV_026121 [Castanea mollissima]|uniref:Uncharacterized protein n=1 Tax=Castanea mollissima TaxID=60419 RepID=A0A8J4VG60_9ROSI|nr:hypothetical protein CMV_026121 [Castanea mollissima]
MASAVKASSIQPISLLLLLLLCLSLPNPNSGPQFLLISLSKLYSSPQYIQLIWFGFVEASFQTQAAAY